MKSRWLLLLFMPALVLATPISLHFSPQPSIEIPSRLEGYSAGALKRFEIELAQRLGRLPDDPQLSHQLGTVLFHQDRREEAQRVWKRSAEMDPNLAPADLMLAVQEVFSLLAKGEAEIATKKLQSIEKQYADSPHFNLVRAEQAVRTGNFESAENTYKYAVTLAPELYVTHLNLGRFYEQRAEFDKALKAYQKAAKTAPERPEPWNFLGAYQYRQGEMKDAYHSFLKSERTNTLQPLAEVHMAKMSLEINDHVGARYWYKAALAREPERPNSIRVALSDVQLRLGLLDEARAEIEGVLEMEKLVPLLVALGYIEETEGNLDAAERLYRRALESQPKNIIAGNNLAMLLIKMNKNPDEAIKIAGSIREQQPANGQILGTYACALLHGNEQKEALKLLSQAVRAVPDDAWSRYCFGKALFKVKNYSEARMHLEGALVLDPEFPRADEIRQLLQTN